MSFKTGCGREIWWTSSSASMIYRNGWIRMITRHLTGEIHGFMWHAAMWETGKAEYLEIKDMFKDVEYFRATASLPYVSHMVEVGGMKLLDGGCTDSIPLRAFAKMGYKKCVVGADPSGGLPQETGQFLAAGGGISQISGVREGASQPLLFL